MIKQISTIYRESDCGGVKAFMCSVILGLIVFLGDTKRFVYKALAYVSKFQAKIFYGILYALLAPSTSVLFFVAGEGSKASTDKSVSIDSFSAPHTDNDRMY